MRLLSMLKFCRTSSTRRWPAAGVLWLGGWLPLVLACSAESLRPQAIPDDRNLYWDLELSHHAVTLSTVAPYDTLRLTATPRNYLAEPLDNLPAPEFRSADQERVEVTADGLLVARAPTTVTRPVMVTATMTTGNLRHTDTLYVRVDTSSTPPLLANLSIHPIPPDSAKVAASFGIHGAALGSIDGSVIDTILPRVVDTAGSLIAGLPVDIRVSDVKVISVLGSVTLTPLSGIEPFYAKGLKPGSTTIYATTTAYGVTKADTLPYRVGQPLFMLMGMGRPAFGESPGTFSAPDVHIGRGGIIVWRRSENLTDQPMTIPDIDITFAEANLPNVVQPNLASPGVDVLTFFDCSIWGDCARGGNILFSGGTFTLASALAMAPPPAMLAARQFPLPGTYTYRSTIYGTTGRIVVVNEE